MGELTWYFPQNPEEVPELLKREGVQIHAGGTGLLMGGLKRVRGLVDLGRLPLRYLRREGDRLSIGAATPYAEVVEGLRATHPDHVLVQALSGAASTPLRNRITVGGSAALFPAWSDLMGPLLALEAEVDLLGPNAGAYPLSRYVEERELRRGALIREIRVKDGRWSAWYFRHGRVRFDYPTFTLTFLMKKKDSEIQDLRLVAVGTTGRWRRLEGLEEALRGKAAAAARIDAAAAGRELDLAGKKGFSSEYLKACAGVELERGLAALLAKN